MGRARALKVSDMDIFSWAESKRLRDENLLSVASYPADDYVHAAKDLAITLAKRNGEVMSEDVRKIMPIPDGINPSVMGAVMKHKNLVPVGIKNSTHVQGHHRRILIYKYDEK